MLTLPLYCHSLTFIRLSRIRTYLQAQTGDEAGFIDKGLITGLLAHKEAKPHLPEGSSFTLGQVALIVIRAELTHKQFDHLCKVSAFSDSNHNSSKLVTKGMPEVDNALPKINPFSNSWHAPSRESIFSPWNT